jgi:tripartite-type tricarboxylate transporter receptor subunit TctC
MIHDQDGVSNLSSDARTRRRFLACAAAVAATAATPRVHAQGQGVDAEALRRSKPADFPARPIELVVTYPAGGGMDITARILARHVEKAIGHPVIVQNRAGAGGLVGATWLATQAPADGHVVGILASNFWGDAILRSEGKWSYRDMEPIAFVNYDPLTWIVNTAGPFGRVGLKEILAAARERPGTVRLAASENSPSGFLARQLEDATGAKFTTVMYQGGRQALTDLLGQHIDVSFGYLGEYVGHLQAGQVKAVGVASPARVALLKDTPTFDEVLGSPGNVWDAFRFAAVPKGTPVDRKAWLERAFHAALSGPEIAGEYAKLGATADRTLSNGRLTADEIERRVAQEIAFYKKIGRLPQ